MPSNRREHLVDTAVRLFYRDGFHATGIDKILAESRVAKMTLYKHFRSKDDLILAAVRRRYVQMRNSLTRAVERIGRTPRERLLALFDALGEWFASDGFSGCMFINACAEFAGCDDPIHAASAEHKRLVAAYVLDLATAAGARDPQDLTQRITLLMEGAMSLAHITGTVDPARHARGAAKTLIEAALDEPA